MARVEPAVAHIACPQCEDVVDVEIPIVVTLDNGGRGPMMRAEVDQEAWSAQELWDHVLAKHGPVT